MAIIGKLLDFAKALFWADGKRISSLTYKKVIVEEAIERQLTILKKDKEIKVD